MNIRDRYERVREFRYYLYNAYGPEKEWPKTFEVSHELYEAVEQVILDWIERVDHDYPFELHTIKFGPNGGIMFKNIELLIKKN